MSTDIKYITNIYNHWREMKKILFQFHLFLLLIFNNNILKGVTYDQWLSICCCKLEWVIPCTSGLMLLVSDIVRGVNCLFEERNKILPGICVFWQELEDLGNFQGDMKFQEVWDFFRMFTRNLGWYHKVLAQLLFTYGTVQTAFVRAPIVKC